MQKTKQISKNAFFFGGTKDGELIEITNFFENNNYDGYRVLRFQQFIDEEKHCCMILASQEKTDKQALILAAEKFVLYQVNPEFLNINRKD